MWPWTRLASLAHTITLLEAQRSHLERTVESLEHQLASAQQDYRQLVGVISSGQLGKATVMPEFAHDIFAEVETPTEADYLTPREDELVPTEDLERGMQEEANDRSQSS